MIYDLNLPAHLSLSACPFCGGEADLNSDGEGVYAGCSSTHCIIKPITLTYRTKRDACKAWNLRQGVSEFNPLVPVGGRLQVVKSSDGSRHD